MRTRFENIHKRLLGYESLTLNKSISQHDGMLDGGLEQYLTIGRSAIYAISHAMLLTGLLHCRNVLDLPCGYGRVLRHLVNFFPESNIVACDLEEEAVDFCKNTFNIEGVYSKKDLSAVSFSTKFDLIWCGSLLTHLPEEMFKEGIQFLVQSLADDGVALITLHGRFTHVVQERYGKLISDELFLKAKEELLSNGFGFSGYEQPGFEAWGVALTTPSFVLGFVEQIPEIQICCYSEREWAGNHDVLMIRKKPFSTGF